MGGVSNLEDLLRRMAPRLYPEEQAYAQLAEGRAPPEGLSPFAVIFEEEGLTLVAPAAALARHGIDHIGGWARISLSVQSDLSAVGLTAAVATALTREGISANVVAGFLHDHLFVPWDRRHDAMAALAVLAGRA